MSNIYDHGIFVTPSFAQFKSVNWDVRDYEYVEADELPDMNHGIVWAHSLGASPKDLFTEIITAIDHKTENVKPKKKWRPKP